MTSVSAGGGRRVSHRRKAFPMVDEEWKADAACTGMPVDLFFPSWGDHDSAEKAKKVCRECPVKYECGKYAYDTGSWDGIFGGMTSRERSNALRRARRNGKGGNAIAQ